MIRKIILSWDLLDYHAVVVCAFSTCSYSVWTDILVYKMGFCGTLKEDVDARTFPSREKSNNMHIILVIVNSIHYRIYNQFKTIWSLLHKYNKYKHSEDQQNICLNFFCTNFVYDHRHNHFFFCRVLWRHPAKSLLSAWHKALGKVFAECLAQGS